MDGLVLVLAIILNPRAKKRERLQGQNKPHDDGDDASVDSSPVTKVQEKSPSSPASIHRVDAISVVAV
jgi:hypothetical protein